MRGNLFASSVLLNPFGALEDEWNKKKIKQQVACWLINISSSYGNGVLPQLTCAILTCPIPHSAFILSSDLIQADSLPPFLYTSPNF